MNPDDWSYVSGHVSALLDRLLDHRATMAVAQAVGADDLRNRLRGSLLFTQTPPGERPLDEVEGRFRQWVEQIAAMCPDRRVADFFLIERDWAAFRRYAQARLLKRETRTTAPDQRYEAALRGEAADERDRPLAEAGGRVAAAVAEAEAVDAIDRILDPWQVAAQVRMAREIGSEPLMQWVETFARLRAALALLRARRNGWDAAAFRQVWREAGCDQRALDDIAAGAPADWPAALEQLGLPRSAQPPAGADDVVRLALAIENRVTELAGAARGIPFGPEKVFAFLWALRVEALNLRLVLSAAEAGLPEARVMAELRAEHA